MHSVPAPNSSQREVRDAARSGWARRTFRPRRRRCKTEKPGNIIGFLPAPGSDFDSEGMSSLDPPSQNAMHGILGAFSFDPSAGRQYG